MSHQIDTEHPFTRRGVLASAAATAITLPGASTAEALEQSGPTKIRKRLTYNQAQFRFATTRLPAIAGAVWHRRGGALTPWRRIQAPRGRSPYLRPTWRDVDAEYRAVMRSGRIVRRIQFIEPSLSGLDPAAFGAVGDGLTDDTAALNRATVTAAKTRTGVDLHGRTYLISGPVGVGNGVSAVFNGTLRESPLMRTYALYIESVVNRRTDNLSNCVFSRLKIEIPDGSSALGIGGSTPSHLAIVHCTIGNKNAPCRPISITNPPANDATSTDIVIRGNTITAADVAGMGIGMFVHLDLDGADTMIDYWKTHLDPARKLTRMTNVEISNNAVSGGYYAIALSGVDQFLVEGNRATRNMRNISAQNSSTRGAIRNNDLRECISSSIHLAYGSSDNRVTSNRIATSRAAGEGLLQAYVATCRNQFIGNRVVARSPLGPKWFIYNAVHAHDNVFENNVLTGPCQRAYIAVEGAWDSTCRLPSHRATNIPMCDDYASEDILRPRIVGNRIDASSPVDLIVLNDITNAAGTFRVRFAEVARNLLADSGATIKPRRLRG